MQDAGEDGAAHLQLKLPVTLLQICSDFRLAESSQLQGC